MRLAIGKVTVTSTNVSQFSNKAIIPDSLSLGDKRPNMYNAQEVNHDKDNSLDKPPLERNGWKDEKDKKGIVDR
jgi:hypothetical protein